MILFDFIFKNLELTDILVNKNHINLKFKFDYISHIYLLIIALFSYIKNLLTIEDLTGSNITLEIESYDIETNKYYFLEFNSSLELFDNLLSFSDKLKECFLKNQIPNKELEITYIEVNILINPSIGLKY